MHKRTGVRKDGNMQYPDDTWKNRAKLIEAFWIGKHNLNATIKDTFQWNNCRIKILSNFIGCTVSYSILKHFVKKPRKWTVFSNKEYSFTKT